MIITLRLNNNSFLDETEFSTNHEINYIKEMEEEYFSTKDLIYDMILHNKIQNIKNNESSKTYNINSNYITCKCDLIDDNDNSLDFYNLLKLIIDNNINYLRFKIIDNDEDFDSEIIFLSKQKELYQIINNYTFDFKINGYIIQFIINKIENYNGKYLTFNIKKISFNKE